ncbi:MAG: hypothetical protein JWO40_208 [Candidatus Doudnabacteria bacterium]|nr:hypothetical protein [Candidatus Doudnabacteria bacterium]
MNELAEILSKAYRYTRNHKFLWFFGFFLTGWGTLNFLRHIDFNIIKLLSQVDTVGDHLRPHPGVITAVLIGGTVLFFGITILGAIARTAIIYTGLHSERKEQIEPNVVLKKINRYFWRVFWLGLFTESFMLLVFSWLSIPLYFIFRGGSSPSNAVILTLLALVIFIPIIIILSLINIFSACYIVIYNLPILPAVKASFDLLAGFWEETMGLFIVLIIIYFSLFFFSAAVLGLFGALAYALASLLKNLPVHSISGILLLIISLISFVLIFVNALLNVFTNFAWTLFFMKIVKAKLTKESEVATTIA